MDLGMPNFKVFWISSCKTRLTLVLLLYIVFVNFQHSAGQFRVQLFQDSPSARRKLEFVQESYTRFFLTCTLFLNEVCSVIWTPTFSLMLCTLNIVSITARLQVVIKNHLYNHRCVSALMYKSLLPLDPVY